VVSIVKLLCVHFRIIPAKSFNVAHTGIERARHEPLDHEGQQSYTDNLNKKLGTANYMGLTLEYKLQEHNLQMRKTVESFISVHVHMRFFFFFLRALQPRGPWPLLSVS
jgi:hypothetical protein